ncbi:SIS domain-containing protein [Sphingomonas koreensis]|nr:SIS domain-containing protein [Sphingomonas koreensis]
MELACDGSDRTARRRVPGMTLMHSEAGEAGTAVARFLASNGAAVARIGARLAADPPAVIVTCARGSSDHAATYGKYLFETMVGVATASAAPSVSSIYCAPASPAPTLCLAISQSGRSPDLLAAVEARKAAGAYVVALVNQPGSPLAAIADDALPLEAGAERSVAATKSYIVSLAALAALAAAWAGDTALAEAVHKLPTLLPRAFALDWSAALPPLMAASSLFVIGRGYSYGIAQEAALKLKETCALHAEAFSSAEVRHGPMALVRDGFPILAFAGSDGAGADVRDIAETFRRRGAAVSLAGGGDLPVIDAHPAIEPILMVQSFYAMVDALALARGLDPDNPPFLAKVTRTR